MNQLVTALLPKSRQLHAKLPTVTASHLFRQRLHCAIVIAVFFGVVGGLLRQSLSFFPGLVDFVIGSANALGSAGPGFEDEESHILFKGLVEVFTPLVQLAALIVEREVGFDDAKVELVHCRQLQVRHPQKT